MLYFLLLFLTLKCGLCFWSKGVVHYTINDRHYDIHSQDVIRSALSDLQKEICIKFFDTPSRYKASIDNKILNIQNLNMSKDCQPQKYNFNADVIEMSIGYKCVNARDVTRIVVEMLRSSIGHTDVNSFDLHRRFQEQVEDSTLLLSPADRNFINAHYHSECSVSRGIASRRVGSQEQSAEDNIGHNTDKLWPLGVVLYHVDSRLRNSRHHVELQEAMAAIELGSCVVFQEMLDDVLSARSVLSFAEHGADAPHLGFVQDNQTISLVAMIEGAPGHTAHTLNLLMRALGVPMASNRYDRDFYVTVNWHNVQKGKEHYLETTPLGLTANIPYDLESATHAPANYMCRDCSRGETTVQPVQDYMWQRTLTMGHRTDLSEGDKRYLRLLYSKPCTQRYATRS